MRLVGVELLALLRHAARERRPLHLLVRTQPFLHRFQRGDVIRSGEAARAVEGEEAVEAHLSGERRFLHGSERPGTYAHAIGRERLEAAHGDRRAVEQHEVGEDQQVAIGIGDALRALGPEPLHELRADALELGLRRVTVDRDPRGDRAAAEVHVVRRAVPIAEIFAQAVRGQHVSLLGTLHLDAGALQVVEPGRMRREQVIVVVAVLDEQLPVRADVVLLRAVDHLHAAGRRLIQYEIDVLDRRTEVFAQRHGVRIEVEKDKTAIGLDAGRLLEAELGAIEIRRISALPRHGVKPPVAVVGPAVIEAGVAIGIALRLAADDGAAMAAGVQENAQLVPAVAAQNQRPSAHRARAKVARRAHLGLMPDVKPAALEDALLLLAEDRGIDERGSIDFETMLLRFVKHDPGRAHPSIIGE